VIIELLYQDKFKFNFEEDLFNKYSERLENISKQSIVHFTQRRVSEKKMLDEIDKKKSSTYIIILEENGKNLNTEQFKDIIFNSSAKKIIFLIGGTNGFKKDVLEKADLTISLSKMTLTHSFAAIILSEQIYRSVTIKIGHPYHRE
jgi:23S rRNA (pseudouridine1915-N3)-methyltransferase